MDIELSSHRTKPVSGKICAEKIDGHAARATEIMQRCLTEQRNRLPMKWRNSTKSAMS